MKIKVLSSIELIILINSISSKQSNNITNNELTLCDKAMNELINRGAI